MMPNLSSTIKGFQRILKFQITVKTVVGGTVAENSKTNTTLWFQGSIFPMKPREVMVKPEGQRRFKFWKLYTVTELMLDWRLTDPEGLNYLVMAKQDYRQGGMFIYDIIQGTDIAPALPRVAA